MGERVPEAGIGLADRVENPEPGRLSMNGAWGDRLLDQVFLFGEFQAGAQDLVHGGRAEDHTGTASFIRRLDDEAAAQEGEVQLGDDRLVDKRRQKDRIGCMDSR